MSQALNWDSLLNTSRIRQNDIGEYTCYLQPEPPPRTPAEADIQRIIFSSPFRRLAGKTQVHPLAKIDYVHNRLTHSLEVAEIGASLAQSIAAKLSLSPERIHACALHVKAACLGHDIGNPPYGHAGEFAIQSWVERHREEIKDLLVKDESSSETSSDQILEDFLKFDGNAQAFRLLSQPSPNNDAYFRLSCASLGALIKYPWSASETPSSKFSCFTTARDCFSLVTRTLGLQTPTGTIRHPLSYITEIADDICYCVTDCEDAVLMGMLDQAHVRKWYLDLLSSRSKSTILPTATLSFIRATVIGDLMQCFTDELVVAFEHPETLINFEHTSPTWRRLKKLKQNYSVVFDDAEKLQKEVKAREEMYRVLDVFLSLLQSLRTAHVATYTSQLQQTPFDETFIITNRHRPYHWWLHLILDYVTGMTDHYLHRFAQTLLS